MHQLPSNKDDRIVLCAIIYDLLVCYSIYIPCTCLFTLLVNFCTLFRWISLFASHIIYSSVTGSLSENLELELCILVFILDCAFWCASWWSKLYISVHPRRITTDYYQDKLYNPDGLLLTWRTTMPRTWYSDSSFGHSTGNLDLEHYHAFSTPRSTL
jgi:hypothetical protein